MNPLAARCRLSLGQLYAELGDHGAAISHLETASAMFREMDMPFWLGQTEIRLRRLPRSSPRPAPALI
jgi:hypothetical protein